eukprot:SAG11_NODE_18870_length_479_cov_1.344737_1_plen_44_part_01
MDITSFFKPSKPPAGVQLRPVQGWNDNHARDRVEEISMGYKQEV